MIRDPSVMYAPWVAHHFPGLTPLAMIEVPWSTYVAMWDSVQGR